MCTLCDLTKTFDPARHAGTASASGSDPGSDPGLPVLATVRESADAAAHTGTAYAMQVGDNFAGTLDRAGDRDWVSVTLQAGQAYRVDLTGGTLADPLLRLYDAGGRFLGTNDDIRLGVILDSQMTFTAPATGTYYLAAGAYADGYAGSYALSITPTSRPQSATVTELAAYLTDGYWQDQGTSGFRFDTSQSNEITVDLTALTPDGRQLARWALELWEMVADLDFVEVTRDAQITFDDNQSGAFAGPDNVVGGFTATASVNIGTGWLATYGTEIDSYSFSTYVHEIGHALGLGHQGNYNGAATYGIDETFANDSWQISVMSYFSQTENTNVNASYAALVSVMMADIIAIQNLYGAPGPGGSTAGNTTWGGAGSSLGNALDKVFDHLDDGFNPDISGGPMALTIYDQGGTDLLDLSWSSGNDRIDLTPGSFSDVDRLTGNFAIAPGTMIENLLAGPGNDDVTGNAAANRIEGGNGHDLLFGGMGFDTLVGGSGNDTVRGGNGRDRAELGDGNDLYEDTGQSGPLGRDTVWGGAGQDTISGGAGDDSLIGGDGNDSLSGGLGHDRLAGEDGADRLDGGAGRDRIYGGADGDLILGGAEGDVIFGGTGNDTVEGGYGRDTAFLGAGNDSYTDTGQSGWLGGDRVFGADGADALGGGGGSDTLDGGPGSDTLDGGSDSDTLIGDTGNDRIDGGTGFDRVYAGAGNDTVAGGDGRDTVYLGEGRDVFEDSAQTGWWGDDRVFAGSGNDRLRDGGGDDTYTGGPGADVFVFRGAGLGDNRITDFTPGLDQLEIEAALWAGATTSVSPAGVLLGFGTAGSVLLEGLTSSAGLTDDITLV